MSRQQITADWNLLPHQPMQFFGLASDFDRRDLKRAYGKLIRKFKPETHPNEFQKIRRAYEELENQVRYGVQQKMIASQTEAWNAVIAADAGTAKEATASSRRTPKVDVPPCSTETALKNPRETYRRLQQQPKKSPQDYFVLAVVSDLMPTKETNLFLKWLLQGVQKFPTDAGLQQVLREYLRTDITLKSAASVLQVCSKTLPSDVFYRLTEPLWDRLLREAEFGAFAKLLATCEKNLKHKDMRARTTFYLHLLRPAVWKAPTAWSDQVMKFLESVGTQLDAAAEHELEFLSMVTEYLREDRDFVEASPVRKLLDEMIRTYCEEDWNTAVAKVAQVQDELARNSHGVIEAFPISEDDGDCYRLFSLCLSIVSDVAEQTAVRFNTENRHSEKQSFAALGDLRDSITPLVMKLQWQRYRSFITPFVAIVLVPPVLVFTAFSSGMIALFGSLIWVAASICVYFMWLKPKVLDPRVDERSDRILLRSYQQKWRSRLFRYVQSCGQAPQQAIENLHEAAVDSGDDSWMNVVLSFIQGDVGLIMFGQAQMFVS